MSEEVIHIDFDEPLLPVKELRCGNIRCLYENGKLRYLKFNGTEFLRMIYFAVRDEQWSTAPYTIDDEVIEENENGFSISYTATHSLNNISFKCDVKIIAKNNAISFAAHGEALSDFRKNRIGICVHHPVEECSGSGCTIIKPDGTTYTARFPLAISPHQPFREMREMLCDIATNLKMHISFSGDTYEMEDQRNWSDASFKTYSTPLDIPFPVEVKKGDIIEQQVAVTISSTGSLSAIPENRKEQKLPFPRIGYSRVKGKRLGPDELLLLSAIPFDHYRVELALYEEDWQKELADALWEAKQLTTNLDLVIQCDDRFEEQIAALVAACKNDVMIVKSILPLQQGQKVTPDRFINLLRHEIAEIAPHIKVGYGSSGSFADLNRNRPGNMHFDFVAFPLNPQVHADDTRSVIENLGRQSDLIETAFSFSLDRPVYVSPVTFKKPGGNEDDHRLHGALGALWTIHTITNLARAEALLFYQTTGSRGIIRAGAESEQTPLYHLLKKIKKFQPKYISTAANNSPIDEDIILENELGQRLRITCPNKINSH